MKSSASAPPQGRSPTGEVALVAAAGRFATAGGFAAASLGGFASANPIEQASSLGRAARLAADRLAAAGLLGRNAGTQTLQHAHALAAGITATGLAATSGLGTTSGLGSAGGLAAADFAAGLGGFASANPVQQADALRGAAGITAGRLAGDRFTTYRLATAFRRETTKQTGLRTRGVRQTEQAGHHGGKDHSILHWEGS